MMSFAINWFRILVISTCFSLWGLFWSDPVSSAGQPAQKENESTLKANIEDLIQQAFRALKARKNDHAFALFTKIVAQKPDGFQGHLGLSIALSRREELEKAIVHSKTALAIIRKGANAEQGGSPLTQARRARENTRREGNALYTLSIHERLAGRLGDAIFHARQAYELYERHRFTDQLPHALAAQRQAEAALSGEKGKSAETTGQTDTALEHYESAWGQALQGQDRQASVRWLTAGASLLSKQNKSDLAERWYRLAIMIAGNDHEQARDVARSKLGVLLSSHRRMVEARKVLQDAIASFDRRGEANASLGPMLTLARLNYDSREIHGTSFSHVETKAIGTGNLPMRIKAMLGTVMKTAKTEQWANVARKLEKTQELAQKTGDRLLLAEVWRAQADLQFDRKNKAGACQLWRQAEAVFTLLDQHPGNYYDLRNTLGSICKNISQNLPDPFGDEHTRQLVSRHKYLNPGDIDLMRAVSTLIQNVKARSTADTASARERQAWPDMKIGWYHPAFDITWQEFIDEKQSGKRADAAFRLGVLKLLMGERGDAIAYFDRARHMDPQNADAWLHLIRLKKLTGQVADVLPLANAAERALAEAPNPGTLVKILVEAGASEMRAEGGGKAADLFARAQVVGTEASHADGEALAIAAQGRHVITHSAKSGADLLFQRAIGIANQGKDRYAVPDFQVGLGISYTRMGLHQNAVSAIEQALTATIALNDHAGQAHARMALGIVYSKLKLPTEAARLLTLAQQQYRDLQDTDGQGLALLNRGEITFSRQTKKQACEDWRSARLMFLRSGNQHALNRTLRHLHDRKCIDKDTKYLIGDIPPREPLTAENRPTADDARNAQELVDQARNIDAKQPELYSRTALQAVLSFPQNTVTWRTYAISLSALDLPHQAAQAWKIAADTQIARYRNIFLGGIYHMQSEIHYQMGNDKMARILAEKSAKEENSVMGNINRMYAHLQLASIEMREGDGQKEIEHLSRAQEFAKLENLEKTIPERAARLGRNYLRRGKWEIAVKHLEEADALLLDFGYYNLNDLALSRVDIGEAAQYAGNRELACLVFRNVRNLMDEEELRIPEALIKQRLMQNECTTEN